MRSRTGIGTLALGAALVAQACSFFVDDSGLAKDDAGTRSNVSVDGTDAGADETDGGRGDGGRGDGAIGDGATANDGGAAPDVANPSGCATYTDASWCVDFEKPNDITTTVWTEVTSGSGSSITLASTTSVSPTHAANILVAQGAPACSFVRLKRRFSGTLTYVRGRAAVRPSRDGVPIAWEIDLPSGVQYNILGVLYSDPKLSIKIQKYDGSTNTVTLLTEKMVALDASPFDVWNEVEITAQTAPTREVTLRLGQTQVTAALASEVPLQDPALSTGIWCEDAPLAVLVDDVAAWVR